MAVSDISKGRAKYKRYPVTSRASEMAFGEKIFHISIYVPKMNLCFVVLHFEVYSSFAPIAGVV